MAESYYMNTEYFKKMAASYYKKAEHFGKMTEYFKKMPLMNYQKPEWINKTPDFVERTNESVKPLRKVIFPCSLILYSFAEWYL